MKLKNILQIAGFLVLVLPVFASDKSVLRVEIRFQKTAVYDTNTYLAFGTDNKIEFDPLSSAEQREDGEFKVLQKRYNLLPKDHRYAVITYINRKPRNWPDQVFLLSLPLKQKPMDWTNWQHPNYVETNAVSNFRFNYTPPDRSTNVPPNSFELRYKVEKT
jgi:hypothetical protein